MLGTVFEVMSYKPLFYRLIKVSLHFEKQLLCAVPFIDDFFKIMQGLIIVLNDQVPIGFLIQVHCNSLQNAEGDRNRKDYASRNMSSIQRSKTETPAPIMPVFLCAAGLTET